MCVVSQSLLGVLWQTVTAVTKTRIIIVCSNSEVKTNSVNNLSGINNIFDCSIP